MIRFISYTTVTIRYYKSLWALLYDGNGALDMPDLYSLVPGFI
ncbi:hypothetical protein [Chryseobacterium populi]|nr:hypothetical protein [Chryseobacterium populi]